MKLKINILLLFLFLFAGVEVQSQLKPLKISPNKRFVVQDDGTPFFYMGCTAWMLPLRLTREKVDIYLDHRAKNGYNVILMSIWIFQDNNAYGEPVFLNNDQTKPNENYFKHVDYIINKASEKGIYICLNPIWGNSGLGGVMGNLSMAEAKVYGEFLGNRYKANTNVIWFIGGDTKGYMSEYLEIAKGIRGKGAGQIMSWHVDGNSSSSSLFSNSDTTIDYHMFQTGHASRNIVPNLAVSDYNKTPAKPTVNSEPNYEDHPINWNSSNGFFDDYDSRKQAYWSVFSGCMGHVYGNHSIWMFYEGTVVHSFFPAPKNNIYWDKAIDSPGSLDMKYVRSLMESRPYLNRIPDRAMVTSGQGSGSTYVAATRDASGSYAMIYIPTSNQTVEVNLAKVSGTSVKQWWFNTSTGVAQLIGEIPNNGAKKSYTSPSGGPDWVLVLDDAARNFGIPGQTSVSTGLNAQAQSVNDGIFTIHSNPANQLAVVSYRLSENSNVKIHVCDELGKEVLQVINQKQIAGEYKVNINTGQLQAGIYFVKMESNGEQQTQKLLVNK